MTLRVVSSFISLGRKEGTDKVIRTRFRAKLPYWEIVCFEAFWKGGSQVFWGSPHS